EQFLACPLQQLVEEGDLQRRGVVGGKSHADLARGEVEVAGAAHHHRVGAQVELLEVDAAAIDGVAGRATSERAADREREIGDVNFVAALRLEEVQFDILHGAPAETE